MKLTIGIANFGRLEFLNNLLTNLDKTTSEIHEIVLVNNGNKPEMDGIVNQFKDKYKITVINNEQNIGLIKSYNQIINNSSGDWVALMHNDIIIYDNDWDKIVEKAIISAPRKIGLVGFAGSKGINLGGCRVSFISNLKSCAEGHGKRISKPEPGVIIEGAVMIANKEMLNDTGGFYDCDCSHYVYDYDFSLASIQAGYFNLIVPISFDHISGVTYLSKEFAKQCPKTEEVNQMAWTHWDKRWKDTGFIPLHVDNWELWWK